VGPAATFQSLPTSSLPGLTRQSIPLTPKNYATAVEWMPGSAAGHDALGLAPQGPRQSSGTISALLPRKSQLRPKPRKRLFTDSATVITGPIQ
jgi:hypothetical protein